ncbi:MAG: hypothetical protein IT348_10970 [Candidatus Eisenbacteria bacterium]|nr:hypothetical protein [Candidatus Eisenbacteria bacterium]
MALTYTKPERISLRAHADLNEKWLQDRIAEDPAILGLGDVSLLGRERTTGQAGRLDLLLSDPEENRRYEVEIMLGPTDPSHIVRTIEYWDIERRRYPAYEHVAVLVAEDITSRFLNVMSLLSGTIPFVAIQLNALKVGEQVVLDFVKVLDQTELRTDDEDEAGETAPADRAYWVQRSSEDIVRMADIILKVICAKTSVGYALKYNRQFIGLSDGVRARRFVHFTPRRKHMAFLARVADPKAWTTRLQEAGVDAGVRRRSVRVSISASELEEFRPLIEELMADAVEHQEVD